VAFYADCHHEVRPIKTGYRIALVYNLTYSGAAVERAAPAQDRMIARLAGCVERHFATPVPRRFSSQPPEAPKKLVYLLDHDYTRHSLRWERLKNGDSARAAALRAVAERLDCEAFLAQADIHESWSCEEDEYDWGRRGYGGYGWDEDDDDDDDDESYELIELLDDDMELRHWIDAAGKPFKDAVGGVADSEVCCAKATVELQPFKSEHEGWMGNYGNTVDRWYRRAAVVLWPRSLAFAIRAEASPGWALDQLARLLTRGEAEDAEEKARSLLPMWERCAGGVPGKTFFAKVLRVASLLDDPEVAAGLVAPLCLGHMGRQAVPHVVRLLERHGLTWWRERFDRWLAGLQRRYGQLELEETWAAFLPTLCRELRRRGAKAEHLARAIAAQQCAHVEQALKAALDPQRVRRRERDLAEVSRAVVQLLLACEAADDLRLRDRVVEHLIRADFPVDALVAALQGERAWDALKGFGLEPLHQHCVSELEAELATPPRSRDDWAIRAELRCVCQLCARLSRFLAARDEVCLEWPLAKERRRHVHGQIDCNRLPVSHTTRRRGSPYTLVLKKTEALFARERERRGTLEKHLAWLNRHGTGGAGERSRKGRARPRLQSPARASLPSSR